MTYGHGLGVSLQQSKDPRTQAIIGAAMEVHKELGSGFLEAVYQEALERELRTRGIEFRSQPVVLIKYKGEVLNKSYQPDFICFDEVLVEIKALSNLSGTEQSQIISYLKATGLETGLLINFGPATLEYRRFVYTK
jgi:GxxExxY protein